MSTSHPTQDIGARDLFLSYNSSNRAAVVTVRQALSARNISTFYDRVDLTPGKPWFDELESALHEVHAVAVFIGKEGLGTVQRREMQFAMARQAIEEKAGRSFPVIPVLLDGADLEAISSFLALNTWVDLRRGLEDPSALDSLAKAVHQKAEARGEESAAAICPYRGLNAFREEDSFLFFGREDFSKKLFDQVLKQSFVAMVGRSGSGKSSIAKAGLMPLLRRQKPPADTWEMLLFNPAGRPFHRLAAQLVPVWSPPDRDQTDIITESEKLGNRLAGGEVTLPGFIDRALKNLPDTSRLVAIVDQFEELFTQTAQPEQRKRFVEQLILASRESSLTIILTLRADYYGQAIELSRDLSDLIAAGILNVGDMTRDELTRAIEQPAVLTGVRFEAGLVDRILDRVGQQPGCLPLLEYALTELWQLRQDGQLTHQAYDAIGGVEGAISKRAQAQFEKLTPVQKEIALPALARLVRVSSASEEGTDTRQIVRLSDLSSDAKSVMRIFSESSARLVVAGRDVTTGDETIEIAHEALIRGWSDLRQWIDKDREFLLWRQQLRPFLEKWRGLSDHKDSALLRGIYLEEARRWLRERPRDLSDEERQFIQASERPSASAKRAKWIVAAAALIVAALALGWWSWISRDAYQIQSAVKEGRAVIISASEFNAEDWLPTLFFSGRTSEALDEASMIGDPDSRASALASFAGKLADSGHTAEAVQMAKNALSAAASANISKLTAASGAAIALAKAGQIQEALNVAAGIDNTQLQAATVGSVMKKVVETGNTKFVIDFFEHSDNSLVNDATLSGVSITLAGAGKAEEALQLANKIKGPNWSSYAKANMAEELAESGKMEEATRLAGEALQMAHLVQKEPDRSYTLNWVVQAFAQTGNKAEALIVANEIQDQTAHAQALSDIAERLAKAGRISEAIEVANEVQKPDLQSVTLGTVVTALARADMSRQAANTVLLLQQKGQIASSPLGGLVDLETVVEWMVEKNASPEEALTIARQIDKPERRSEALAMVADALMQQGKSQEAGEVATDALADARKSPKVLQDRSLKMRVETLSTIMQVLGNAGMSTPSKTAAAQARATAVAIVDDGEKSDAFAEIGKAYAKMHAYRQALSVADLCATSDDKLSVYTAMVREYTIQHHPELAKSLAD